MKRATRRCSTCAPIERGRNQIGRVLIAPAFTCRMRIAPCRPSLRTILEPERFACMSPRHRPVSVALQRGSRPGRAQRSERISGMAGRPAWAPRRPPVPPIGQPGGETWPANAPFKQTFVHRALTRRILPCRAQAAPGACRRRRLRASASEIRG